MTSAIKDIYYNVFGTDPSSIEEIAAGGSNRKYYRVCDSLEKSVIATVGNSYEENNAFIELAKHFYSHDINVPKIIGYNESKSVYMQEDLGDTSLFSILGTDAAPNLIAKTISALARLQTVPGIDYSVCYPEAKFDRKLIMWDLNYFKYCFLKIAVENFNESDLEVDFNRLADKLLSTPESLWGFMYRDCQSRNVIIKDEEPWWIEAIMDELKGAGLIPIIAHPERYYCVQDDPELLYEWRMQGALAQMNKGSILGRFGREIERTAEILLRKHLFTCIASDAHHAHIRTTDMRELQYYLQNHYSLIEQDRLLRQNPFSILQGIAIKNK